MDLIALAGITFAGIGFFLSLFYLFRNKFQNDGYLFLYLALGILAYEVFYKTLLHSRLIYEFLSLYTTRRFFNLMIYPILLFFIWSITKKAFRLQRAHKLVLALFAGYSLYTLVYSLAISPDVKRELLDQFYADGRPGPFNYWANGGTLIRSTLIPLVFVGISGYDFFQFRRRQPQLQHRRLLHFVALIIGLYFFYFQFSNLIYQLAYRYTGFSMIEWPTDILFLSVILLLLAIVTLSVNSGDTFFPPVKYAASALDKQTYQELVDQARKLIEREHLYTNPQLTIADLADGLNTNSKYLSQAINDLLGLSFPDFINQYRVEEARRQLLYAENRTLTIEAIGQLAGFRSKSSFFRAFKKMTGLTPNQYIKTADSPPKQ